jgi:hypothetical protein
MSNESMPEPQAIPRARQISALTARKYREDVAGCRNYSGWKRTEPGEDSMVPPSAIQVVDDVLSREDISERSRRTYISALLWDFRTRGDQSLLTRVAYWRLDRVSRKSDQPADRGRGVPSRVLRSPAAKIIPEDDFHRLRAELDKTAHRADWTSRAASWMAAALGTGIRPIEWLHAGWTDTQQKDALTALTGKAKTSGPAFADAQPESDDAVPVSVQFIVFREPRQVPVLDDFTRGNVERHLSALREATQGAASPAEQYDLFRKYYEQCAQALRRACNRVWKGKKKYTLRTMRSQAFANCKALYGSEMAARIMGHSSEDSPSAAYYAKANQAWPRFRQTRENMSEGEQVVDGAREGCNPRDTGWMGANSCDEPDRSNALTSNETP